MKKPFLILVNPRDASSVKEQPVAQFADWRLLELPGNGDRHLIGRPIGIADSRVTTAIHAIDLKARTLRTQSGRVYQLVSPPTNDPERLVAIYAHAAVNGLDVDTALDVSMEFWAAVVGRSHNDLRWHRLGRCR
jgi:hypothetical protein